MKVRAAQLIADYPRDPRPRFLRVADLLDAGDVAGAEREARAGLAEEELWRSTLSSDPDNGLRAILALAINETHPEEALATARPVCAVSKDGRMHKVLDAKKLCGP